MSPLGIIIPCLNEQHHLAERLRLIAGQLAFPDQVQFFVVDAYEDEGSRRIAEQMGCLYVATGYARRSHQLNAGARLAEGCDALFFLHLDSTPPQGFDALISAALRGGAESGCFRLAFDRGGTFLSVLAWFSRFHWPVARGGDQGLFVTAQAFASEGGFREDFAHMEDIALCRRLLMRKSFTILPHTITTSARKYERVGVLKLQLIFGLMHAMYWVGLPPERISAFYKRFVG